MDLDTYSQDQYKQKIIGCKDKQKQFSYKVFTVNCPMCGKMPGKGG